MKGGIQRLIIAQRGAEPKRLRTAGLNSRCVLLRCAFCKILFMPASGKILFFYSTVCLLKKKNVIGNVDNKI